MSASSTPFQAQPLPTASPSSGGADFRSLEMVHAAGASTGLVSGFATAHGHAGYGVAAMRQQSDLSRSTAPPTDRHPLLRACLGFSVAFAGMAVFLFGVNAGPMPVLLISLVAGVMLGAALWYPAHQYKRDELPRLVHEWRQTFMCQRCGYRFRR